MPERRPVSTIKSARAFTNSLRHAAVVKSGSSSTVTPVPRNRSAIVFAPCRLRQHQPDSRAQPNPALRVRLAENHTTAGTTSDDGHSGPTRSTCSTPFCSAHTTVRSSQSRPNHPAADWFWVSLTASRTTSTGPSTSAGSVSTGPGTTIGSLSVGPDLHLVARCVPAQQHVMTRGVQQCRHGRADCPWADDRDAGSARTPKLPAEEPPLDCGRPAVRSFPGSFRAAQSCRRFVTGHRCRSEGDVGRLGGAPPRPRRGDLHRPARRLGSVAGGVPRGRRAGRRPPAARRVLHRCRGCRRDPARGQRQPGDPHR